MITAVQRCIILPAWIQEGGLQKLNERLADPSVRKQVIGEIKTDKLG